MTMKVVAGGQSFRQATIIEAESLADLREADTPEWDAKVDELEKQIDVGELTRLDLTIERVR